MTNSKREYNETIRANLPYGIEYDSTRFQYVTFNGKRFVTYLEAKWYIDYLTKFGGGPEDDIRNDLFGASEEGVWFEANDSTTLFTDVLGTTPVTTPGDAVALQLDKSQGLTLGPELVSSPTIVNDWVDNGDGSFSVTSASAISRLNVSTVTEGTAYRLNYTISGDTLSVRCGNASSGLNRPAGDYSELRVANADGIISFTATTGETATVSNISVRELPGNHRTQATTAARPLYALHPVGGVRNLLEYTEEFDNAYWVKTNATVTANAAVAPDGTTTADTTNDPTTSYGTIARRVVYSPSSTASLYVKKDAIGRATRFPALRISYSVPSSQFYDIFFDTSTGEYTLSSGASGNVIDEGDYWRVWVSGTDTGSNTTLTYILFPAVGASSTWTPSPTATGSIVAWGAQLEEGSTATNYQRVGSFLDVSEEGKARRGRIWYNGTSHFMETGTITPGTDKAQVFTGVRKLRNDIQEAVVELNNFAERGLSVQTLATFAPWRFGSRGDAAPSLADATSNTFPSPVSSIITGLGDISGDSAILRVDGVEIAESTAEQGLGNYANSVLRFGARAGISLFFNGYEDTSIVRFGPNLDDTTISKVESYVASKTPEETI